MIAEEAKAGLRTKQFLQAISRHLSGREDCKGLEYQVRIYEQFEPPCLCVEVSPYIQVFPNTFNRKDTDRRSIEYHVTHHHFPELIIESTDSALRLLKGSLVPGSYKYRKYLMTRRRRWQKMKGVTHEPKLH